ncbi:MAG: uroporphyrinogen-III synthase [Alphaproteobacteria bacterium]|nr:uroporphyrinogen-III synthase [Alphaproteobacteria bacterium]
MMRILLTRPRADAVELAAELARRGHETLLQPLMEIEPRTGVTIDFSDAQAVLATSANGVRAIAAATSAREIALYAVGDATARAARAVGFTRVVSAAGDVNALARRVTDDLDPTAGRLIHVAASEIAGELQADLGRQGFTVERVTLYTAKPATTLAGEVKTALRNNEIDAALFFSPRTARTFAKLTTEAGLVSSCRLIVAVCLSAAVAGALQAVPWRLIAVAVRPDQAALLTALDVFQERR